MEAAIVAGATSGIGKATTRLLACASDIGKPAHAVAFDICNKAGGFFQSPEALKPLGLLVNDADVVIGAAPAKASDVNR